MQVKRLNMAYEGFSENGVAQSLQNDQALQASIQLVEIRNFPWGGYSLDFLVGVCRPHLQIQTQFQAKNAISHTRFQTWLQKSIPVFRP